MVYSWIDINFEYGCLVFQFSWNSRCVFLRLHIVLELLEISCNCSICFVLYIWTQFKLFLRYFSRKKFKLLFKLKETCLSSICVWKWLAYKKKKFKFSVDNHLISTKVTLGKPFGAISSFWQWNILTFLTKSRVEEKLDPNELMPKMA